MAENDIDSEAMLAFFGQLGKGVDDLKVKVTNLNAAGDAMNKMTVATQRFGQTVSIQTAGPIKGLEVGLFRAVGAVGSLAFGIVAIAKAFDSIASSSLRSRNFAINTGFTTANVKEMKLQLAAAGISADDASQGIANIGAKLQEVQALQEASPFYRTLQASDPLMAANVLHLMKAGKQQEALNVLQQNFNKEGQRFQAWLPTVTGMSRAAWEAQKTKMEGLIPAWKVEKGAAAQYHKNMVNLGTIFDGVWTEITYKMLNGVMELTGSKGIDELNTKAKKFTENFKQYFDANVLPTLKTTMAEIKAIYGFYKSIQSDAPEPEGYDPDVEAKKWNDIWDWFTKPFGYGSSSNKLSSDAGVGDIVIRSETIDVSKEANGSIHDIRDLFLKWENQEGGRGSVGVGGHMAGGLGSRTAGYSSGGSPEGQQGGPVGLSDQAGRKIDPETMRQAEILGRAGDVAGLQRLFSQKGYQASGRYCGIVAAQYVKSAGFQPPTGSAIATNWHKWGETIKDPNDINAPDRPFGSMVGTYWHRRYGGNYGQVLATGQTGGHVVTFIPGSYDPKTRKIDVVDQYGYTHRKRSIDDMDMRYAGAEAVAAAKALREGGDRKQIDRAIASPSNSSSSFSKLLINLKNVPSGIKTDAGGDGFGEVKVNRENRLPEAEPFMAPTPR
jgi:hypothetical protein